MSRLLLLLTIVALSISANGADIEAAPCLTKEQARQKYKSSYLYWTGGPRGQRCWSDRRRDKRIRFVTPPKVKVVIPPLEIADVPVPQWLPSWRWTFDEAFAKSEEPIYSTFAPGEEPDVWPLLPPPASGADLVMVVMMGISGLIFGVMFVRWQSRRIRITR